jgi:ubiquinone/menaquinone biosynthesis C-methylase UbiE
MKEYYEDLWERLPADLDPPDFEHRRAFLLGELQPGDRVLDLGCGTGEFAAAAATAGAGRVTGADVAETALTRARSRHPGIAFEPVAFDGPLPFDDNAFDLVWAGEVIEHVADTARWLSEVRRVLAPRGRLLVTTPSHGRVPLLVHGVEPFSPPLGDHLHLYTARSLRELLHDFGFDPVSVRAALGPPLLRRSLYARAVR